MSDTDTLLRAINDWRTESHRQTAELHHEVRTGFREINNTLRDQHGRVSRHSERFAALDKKRGGLLSGGYQTRTDKVPMAPWVKYGVIPGCSAVAGMIAVKVVPPLLALLAELVK